MMEWNGFLRMGGMGVFWMDSQSVCECVSFNIAGSFTAIEGGFSQQVSRRSRVE